MTELSGFSPADFLKCPRCAEPLSLHEYVDLCPAPVGTDRQMEIEVLVDEERWREIVLLPREALAQDVRVLRALRCPSGTGALVPLQLSPTVYEDDRICGLVYSLDATTVKNLSASLDRLDLAWQSFSETWKDRNDCQSGTK